MASFDQGPAPQKSDVRRQSLVNLAGAAVSLGLIGGVAVWGYHLIMRDVSGIPVVRAMQGEMRVLPDDPGGDVAVHTGLAVNELIAEGEAGGPEDRLVLAPNAPALTVEDLEVAAGPIAPPQLTPAPDVTADDVPVAVAAPAIPDPVQPVIDPDLTPDDVLAILDDIVVAQAAPSNTLVRSLRPVPRPARLAAPAAAAATPAEVAVTTENFAAGTDLVQLGAFSSPSVAAQEWDRLQTRFGALMNGRERVIQVSNQTSGTWYRLRASGFRDRDDARRFCAALQAEGAECIAVVVD
jgi:hypothetical protein